MLLKLMKHEFRNNFKEIMLVNGGIIVVSALISFLSGLKLFRLASFLLLSLSILYIISIALIVISVIRSFHTKMFTNQGYLTMTLPISTDHLLLSKIIVNLIWIILTVIIFAVSLILTISTFLGTDVLSILGGIHSILTTNPLGVLIYIIYSSISLLLFIMSIILTLAILNIGKIKKYTLLIGIAIFYGLNFAIQLLNSTLIIVPYALTLNANKVMLVKFNPGEVNGAFIGNPLFMSLNSLIITCGCIIGFYFISRHLIKNKLELL